MAGCIGKKGSTLPAKSPPFWMLVQRISFKLWNCESTRYTWDVFLYLRKGEGIIAVRYKLICKILIFLTLLLKEINAKLPTVCTR